MPSDEDTGADERRLYGTKREETAAYVASALGITRVELAGDQVGRFSLERQCTATGVAGDEGTLVVGTDEDVLVGTDDGFVETGFGPATAVTVANGTPAAAGPDGEVARLVEKEWETLGTVGHVRRMDGDLLAANNGVYRIDTGLPALGGGNTVRDVAAAGPYAATAEGVLAYDGGEWTCLVDGDYSLVAADGQRTHALGQAGLREQRGEEWYTSEMPVDAPIADLTHGESLMAVTADGTLLVNADPEVTADGHGGWRSRILGVREVAGLAVA